MDVSQRALVWLGRSQSVRIVESDVQTRAHICVPNWNFKWVRIFQTKIASVVPNMKLEQTDSPAWVYACVSDSGSLVIDHYTKYQTYFFSPQIKNWDLVLNGHRTHSIPVEMAMIKSDVRVSFSRVFHSFECEAANTSWLGWTKQKISVFFLFVRPTEPELCVKKTWWMNYNSFCFISYIIT